MTALFGPALHPSLQLAALVALYLAWTVALVGVVVMVDVDGVAVVVEV